MNKIIELVIDFADQTLEDLGVNIMSLVDQPAIGVNWMAFSEEKFVKPSPGESEDDFIGRCMSQVTGEGYPQDQALAICYSYWEDGFGTDTSGLSPYVDQIEDPLQKAIYLAASELGEEYDPKDTIVLELNRSEFSTVGEVLNGILALDILGKGDIRRDTPAETKYRYTGPPGQRFFCRGMMRLNKLYTREEINEITRRTSSLNPGMGHNSSTYSVWNYKGGVNCQHYWEELQVFRNPNGQLVMISNGPAPGDAGEVASPSNNYWRFSTDDDQMIVTGPAMVPGMLIPRRDPLGNPYHVFFSEDTVRKIAKEFIARNNTNNTDINHDEKITNENTLLESWIVEDPKMDKAAALGFGVPAGTWMVSYQINNQDTWALIKEGKLNGFSVAGDFIQKIA